MKKFLIALGVIILIVICYKSCVEDDIDPLSNIDGIEGKVKSAEGNVIVLESGLRVRVIGTKSGDDWVESYLNANVVGKRVRLVADRQIKKQMAEYDREIPAYVILYDNMPSVNHMIVNDNPRVFDSRELRDSLSAITPRANMASEISDLPLYMKSRSFLIETPEGIGTGFFISADGLALTNNHVLPDARGKIWRFNKGHDDNGVSKENILSISQVIYTDPTLDITVFQVDLNGGKVDYFNLGDRHVPQGTKVATYGNPGGLTATYGSGELSGYRNDLIEGRPLVQYDVSTNPGNSGGAVADGYGNVVAVHDLGATGLKDTNFGIDILEVRKVLDKYQLKYGGL